MPLLDVLQDFLVTDLPPGFEEYTVCFTSYGKEVRTDHGYDYYKIIFEDKCCVLCEIPNEGSTEDITFVLFKWNQSTLSFQESRACLIQIKNRRGDPIRDGVSSLNLSSHFCGSPGTQREESIRILKNNEFLCTAI